MSRLTPRLRKQQLLDIGLLVASDIGYGHLSRVHVATRAKVSPCLINVYFKTIINFRKAILRHAIKRENHIVIAQGLIAHDPIALRVPPALRLKALHESMPCR